VPRPELPEEVMELAQSWQESVHNASTLPAVPGTDLDMDTRHVLIDVGKKAARRMQAMIDDDSAWGAGGWIEPRKQAETLGMMLAKAYGQMPSGARFLRLPDGTTGDRQRSEELDERMQVETIGLMVQRRVRRGREGEEGVEDARVAQEEEGTQRSAYAVSGRYVQRDTTVEGERYGQGYTSPATPEPSSPTSGSGSFVRDDDDQPRRRRRKA
jgi:hypothetical protein